MRRHLLDAVVRHVDDRDPVMRRRIEVDVVDADAVAPDHAPIRTALDDLDADLSVLDENAVRRARRGHDREPRDAAGVLDRHPERGGSGGLDNDVSVRRIENDEPTAHVGRSSR